MGDAEIDPPLSRSKSEIFLMGRDSHGNWVVQDRRHRCGGLFSNRADALKFALFENGNQPQAVIMVAGPLELDMRDETGSPRQMPGDSDLSHARRAA